MKASCITHLIFLVTLQSTSILGNCLWSWSCLLLHWWKNDSTLIPRHKKKKKYWKKTRLFPRDRKTRESNLKARNNKSLLKFSMLDCCGKTGVCRREEVKSPNPDRKEILELHPAFAPTITSPCLPLLPSHSSFPLEWFLCSSHHRDVSFKEVAERPSHKNDCSFRLH